MKLISAHIINFGKLHDVDLSFDEKLNMVLHENGWGKTTLSVFLKAMFYGMEHSTSRDPAKNEKKKYEPWQGGIYGGTLTFSHGDRKYRISRTFSTAANSDTFELIDLTTNKVSDDFSADLGTELFGVSRDTYARSAYVTLDEIPAGSSDITARLNHLVEEDDVTSFDAAVEVLDKKATDLKAKRGSTGIISHLQEKIDEDRSSLDEITTLLAANRKLLENIEEESAEVEKCREKQDAVNARIIDNAKFESKARYEQLQNDVARAAQVKKETEAFFNGSVPSAETLKNLDILSTDYTTVASNIQKQSASQSQKDEYRDLSAWFAGDIPTREQIDACLKADQALKAFSQASASKKLTGSEEAEYAKLSGTFADGKVTDQVISGYMESVTAIQKMKDERTSLKEALAEKERETDGKAAEKVKIMRKAVICFCAAGVALVAGAVLFFLKLASPVLSAAVAGAVAAAAVIDGIVLKKKCSSGAQSALSDELASLADKIAALDTGLSEKENSLSWFTGAYAPGSASVFTALSTIRSTYDEYSRLHAKKKAYDEWLSCQTGSESHVNTLKTFMKRYMKTDDISSVATDIQILNDKITKLENLKKLINADSANSTSLAELAGKLDAALSSYQTDRTTDYALQVQLVHEKCTTLSGLQNALTAAEANLAAFKAEHAAEIDGYAALTRPEKTTEELKASLTGLTNEITERNKRISGYQKELDNNLAKTDKEEDIKSEIEELMLEKQEKTKEHEMLLTTQKLLKQAKDNLDRNYSASMIDGFNKYIGMLGTDLTLAIDKDLNVSVDAEGSFHKSDYLSEGYKDMVNFCARMALVDALFEDVTPPVILDDPFVNLDDAKVPNALKLVKDLANEKQVIYFACHKSREVK